MRVAEFAENRKPDFSGNPPKKGDVAFAETLAGIDGVIDDLGGKAAIQGGGRYGQESEDQRVARGEVEETLRGINRDAAAIAAQRKEPGIMDRFRMPYGSGDAELTIKLRAFADAIDELALAAAFDALAQEETPASLRAMADNFEGSEGEQGVALGAQSGATTVIPLVLARGRTAVRTFNSLFNNRYRDDAETLGAWKSVSRVRRTGGGGPDDVTPTPPA